MDKNLNMGPRAEKKFEKRDLEQTKFEKMGPRLNKNHLQSLGKKLQVTEIFSFQLTDETKGIISETKLSP